VRVLHGLQAATGAKMGNSWLANAFLGSSVSSLITGGQFVQSIYPPNPSALTAGQTLSTTAGEYLSDVGVGQAAKVVPNVSFTVAATATASLQTPTSSATLGLNASMSGTLPFGTVANAAANVLGGFGKWVKAPIDLTVGGFSALVCSIGR
jgi:hypothetical protein